MELKIKNMSLLKKIKLSTSTFQPLPRLKFCDCELRTMVGTRIVPSVAEWSIALESDASAGGESPVRAPVRAATLCPYA